MLALINVTALPAPGTMVPVSVIARLGTTAWAAVILGLPIISVINPNRRSINDCAPLPPVTKGSIVCEVVVYVPVSYTHLTLPTKRIV